MLQLLCKDTFKFNTLKWLVIIFFINVFLIFYKFSDAKVQDMGA